MILAMCCPPRLYLHDAVHAERVRIRPLAVRRELTAVIHTCWGDDNSRHQIKQHCDSRAIRGQRRSGPPRFISRLSPLEGSTSSWPTHHGDELMQGK